MEPVGQTRGGAAPREERMPSNDGNRSRPGRDADDGTPGTSSDTHTELSPGKQSRVHEEFGVVGPGNDATFGILAPFGPIQQPRVDADDRPAPNDAARAGDGGPRRHDDSPVQARTGSDGAPGAASEAGVHAAAAQGIATPSSRLPPGFTIRDLFG